MSTPHLPSAIEVGAYRFSGPQPWHHTVPPVGGGLYALLVPDLFGSADYQLISVGEAENLRATFFQLRGGPLQQLARDYGPRIHVAWLQMPLADRDRRRLAEAEIIRDFLPELRTYRLFLSHS